MFETAVAYVAIPALMLPFIELIQVEEYLAVLSIINVPIVVIWFDLINLYLLIWRWFPLAEVVNDIAKYACAFGYCSLLKELEFYLEITC